MPPIHIPTRCHPALHGHRVPHRPNLDEYGDAGLVARSWQWVLRGGGLGPISNMDWSQFDGDGPPR